MSLVLRSLGVCSLAVVLSSCAYNRNEQLPFASASQSNLNRKNFRVVRANVQGVSHGFNLFGFVPIVSPSVSEAMHTLHQQVNDEGKAIALVNVAEDRTTTYLVLFSIPTLTVSADAIEFLDEAAAVPNAGSSTAAAPGYR